jgi:hypothetical protein
MLVRKSKNKNKNNLKGFRCQASWSEIKVRAKKRYDPTKKLG